MRSRWFWIAAAAYALAALLAVVFAPGWFAYLEQPKASPADRVLAVSSARQAVLFTAGGLIALIGVVVSLARNSREANHEALERDQHWTQRFTDAGTMLGGDKEATRLAGIYSMRRLGLEAQEEHDIDTVVSVLSAMLRFTRVEEDQPPPVGGELGKRERTALIESVAMLSSRARRPISLTFAELGSAHLVGANLAGATIVGAHLVGSNLSEANLEGADLRRSNLSRVNLTEANLRKAYLPYAELRGTILVHANFEEADLTEVNLERADLRYAFFGKAHLSGANFMGARLEHANFTDADLSNASLVDADLTHANMSGANVTGADLTGVIGFTSQL